MYIFRSKILFLFLVFFPLPDVLPVARLVYSSIPTTFFTD